jgi:hypothetical protein
VALKSLQNKQFPAIARLSTGPKERPLVASVLAVPGTAIGIGETAVTCRETAIAIGFIHQRVTIVVHAVGAVDFVEEERYAAVHRAIALALAWIAKAVAAAVRGGLCVVAD